VSVSPKQPDAGETGQDDEADEESEFEDEQRGKGETLPKIVSAHGKRDGKAVNPSSRRTESK
jgi:hypothetical protein